MAISDDGEPISTNWPPFSTARLLPGEVYTCTLRCRGVRFRAHEPRQDPPAGNGRAALRAAASDRRPQARRALHDAFAGDLARDREPLLQALAALRDMVTDLPDDPHLHYATDVHSSRVVRSNPLPAPEGDHRDRARRGARARPGRHLRRGAGLSRLRQLARAAQLARSDELQSAVEPLSPRGQGGEDGLRRLRLVGSGVRREDARRPRASGAAGRSGAIARAGKLSRVSDADGDGGDRRHALLGRILRTRAGDAAELPVPDAGRRGGARRLGVVQRKHRRRRRAGVSGRGLCAARLGAAGRRTDGSSARWSARAPRRNSRWPPTAPMRRRARIARHGGRRACAATTRWRRSTPGSTSAISGI